MLFSYRSTMCTRIHVNLDQITTLFTYLLKFLVYLNAFISLKSCNLWLSKHAVLVIDQQMSTRISCKFRPNHCIVCLFT